MVFTSGQLADPVTRADLLPTMLKAAEFTTVYRGKSNEIIRSSWLLELVVDGSLSVNVARGGWKDCEKHFGILYAPGTSCSERASFNAKPGTPTTSLYMEFDLSDNHPFGDLLGSVKRYAWIEDRRGSLEDRLRILVDAIDGGMYSASVYAFGTYLQIMSLLIAAEFKGDSLVIGQAGLPMPDLIIKTHGYMREHMDKPIRLKDIARHVGLSESGLSHAYARITGRSPLVALRDFRIEAARNKILHGSLTLSAIAEQTGFSDAFHLSRTFKKVIGASPREYVKSLRSR